MRRSFYRLDQPAHKETPPMRYGKLLEFLKAHATRLQSTLIADSLEFPNSNAWREDVAFWIRTNLQVHSAILRTWIQLAQWNSKQAILAVSEYARRCYFSESLIINPFRLPTFWERRLHRHFVQLEVEMFSLYPLTMPQNICSDNQKEMLSSQDRNWSVIRNN